MYRSAEQGGLRALAAEAGAGHPERATSSGAGRGCARRRWPPTASLVDDFKIIVTAGRGPRGQRPVARRDRLARHRPTRRRRGRRDVRTRGRTCGRAGRRLRRPTSSPSRSSTSRRRSSAASIIVDRSRIRREGERGIGSHQVIEPVGGDDHQGDRVGGDRGGRAGRVPEERDVPEQLALARVRSRRSSPPICLRISTRPMWTMNASPLASSPSRKIPLRARTSSSAPLRSGGS